MKIVINPFDKKSIAQAEKLLKKYKKDFHMHVLHCHYRTDL